MMMMMMDDYFRSKTYLAVHSRPGVPVRRQRVRRRRRAGARPPPPRTDRTPTRTAARSACGAGTEPATGTCGRFVPVHNQTYNLHPVKANVFNMIYVVKPTGLQVFFEDDNYLQNGKVLNVTKF